MILDPNLSSDVEELQQEVIHLRRVVEYMGWKAICTAQQMGETWPSELNDVISAFITEEIKNEHRGTIQ